MKKYIIKNCKSHGASEFILEGRGYYRCTKCRSNAVSKRRKNLKIKLVHHFGGKCLKCGYGKCISALVFHHPHKNKEFGISAKGLTRSFKKALKEAKKCILLCSNCHAEEHDDGE